MDRIKGLLIEARSELKDLKSKQKPLLERWIAKSQGLEHDDTDQTVIDLMTVVKFVGAEIATTKALVAKYEQELGEAWDEDHDMLASYPLAAPEEDSSNGFSAPPAATATSSSSENKELEKLRKDVLKYCNMSRGVDADVVQWKMKLPYLSKRAKSLVSDKLAKRLAEIGSNVEDIKASREELIAWYALAFPHNRQPSGKEASADSKKLGRPPVVTHSSKSKTSAPSAHPAAGGGDEDSESSSSGDETVVSKVLSPKHKKGVEDVDLSSSGGEDEPPVAAKAAAVPKHSSPVPPPSKPMVPVVPTSSNKKLKMGNGGREEMKKPQRKSGGGKNKKLPPLL